MSYAIVRNRKLTESRVIGANSHNGRKTKNHTNKNIDSTKTHLNYYLKEHEISYLKEFKKIKEKYDLKGQIKVTSNIMCELIFTSDQKYFDEIGLEETKRYFKESYNFICKYKNLGEQNIVSAVVHLDEDTPHMHLLFIPVVHTKDKAGNKIDKISCRDFWRGRNSYRDLQDKFFGHISSKGFHLERGEVVEITDRKHYSMEEYKQITNYENTKNVLQNTKLDMPEVPNIKEFNKFMIGRDEKIIKEIIKPKDELIEELYQDNVALHKELLKQDKVVDTASKYEKERETILTENKLLKEKCEEIENTFEKRNKNLDKNIQFKQEQLEQEFEKKAYKLENQYHSTIHKLEKENRFLKKTIDRFKITVEKFITWICHKFSIPSEDQIIRDFEEETYMNLNPEKQLNIDRFKEKEQENELEL